MAVNRRNRANVGYGLDNALQKLSPTPIIANRAPTNKDAGELGTLWVDKSAPAFHILTLASGGTFEWSTTSAGTTIDGDTGTATGNPVTLTGGTSGAVFTGTGSTMTQSFDFLALPATTATDGQITLDGDRFLHAFGTQNTFVGANAGNLTNTAASCVGIGSGAIDSITSAGNIVAIGKLAGNDLTSGGSNSVVIGTEAAAQHSTGGTDSVFIGYFAGSASSMGNYNIGIGYDSGSGSGISQGSSNICINNRTTGGSTSNALTLGAGTGTGNQQLDKAFIHGIRGITTANADAVAVLVDSAGQLGTVSSSIRYKENVSDMDDTSSPILNLRPVTFDFIGKPSHKKQVGLIAEEVEEIMPSLVAYNKDGEVESVKYHDLPALLLNELKKAVKEIELLKKEVAELKSK